MAANPVKGEVQFEVDGKPYIFKFGTNAQVIMEERTKMTMLDIMKNIQEGGGRFGATHLRLIFFAGLSARHPGITEDQCGDLIDELGHEKCADIFLKAMGLAAAKGNGSDPMMPGQVAGQIGTNS